MDPIVLVLISLAVGILTVLFYLSKSKKTSNEEVNEPQQAARQNQQVRRLPAARNRLRNQPRNQRREVVDEDADEDDDLRGEVGGRGLREEAYEDEEEEDEQTAAEREELRRRIGTKKLAKMEEKAARKEQNEIMRREREERKAKEEQMYEERKRREQEEERLEKEREEEEKRLKEEQEKKEYEEYLKLKEQFTVDEEGQDAAQSDLNSENLLLEFVNYIKEAKIVVLEDLAAEFKLKTQDVINRVNLVQEMGILTGVMDDRGKFIYISEEELLKVKKFIEQRGRVSITELAKHSNELINLKPNTTNLIQDEITA